MNKFRCTKDILLNDVEIQSGGFFKVYLKAYSKGCNLLQSLNPLTSEQPFYCACIRTLAPYSKVTFGIAGPDISLNAHPGHWFNSVGYHCDSGQCFTSHQSVANTEGQQLGIGDVIGVFVTYFGDKKSTVLFLKNGFPVATRFLYEPNHSHYFPTIALENGPLDLDLTWPQAVLHVPMYSEKNLQHWICPESVQYDDNSRSFVCQGESDVNKELIIQSPQPLSPESHHFEVVLDNTLQGYPNPSVALAGCSPMISPPISPFVQDCIRFDVDKNQTISEKGHRIGWGIHYSPELRDRLDFKPKAEQLVYCYVTADKKVILGRVIMQPEGGFFPVVILTHGVSKVEVDVASHFKTIEQTQLLDKSFRNEVGKANKQILASLKRAQTEVKRSMLHTSTDVEVTITSEDCRLLLPHEKPGMHFVQFTRPLTEDSNYFLVSIKSLKNNSAVGIGVAEKNMNLDFPGKLTPSVGYISKDGWLYSNSKHDGNLPGEHYYEGDTIGVEIEAFTKNMSVVLFTKNMRPVGTVYYTQPNKEEYLPTIMMHSDGHEIVVEVFFQNMIRGAPVLNVKNLDHWCLPPKSFVDHRTNTVYVKEHQTPVCIQAPYSLHKGYNHFEVHLTKQFNSSCSPAIVLSTATPLEPPPKSCFKLDFLRFWPDEGASDFVNVGDLVGWGLLYINETLPHDEEQLVICYLTVNRKILLVRVVYQPPGGFYPLVVLPPGLNEVTLDFGANVIKQHPITSNDIKILVAEAQELLEKEKEILDKGGDPISELAGYPLFQPLPSKKLDNRPDKQSAETVPDKIVHKCRKINKMAITITDSPFNVKKLKRKSIHSDHKNSVSCMIL